MSCFGPEGSLGHKSVSLSLSTWRPWWTLWWLVFTTKRTICRLQLNSVSRISTLKKTNCILECSLIVHVTLPGIFMCFDYVFWSEDRIFPPWALFWLRCVEGRRRGDPRPSVRVVVEPGSSLLGSGPHCVRWWPAAKRAVWRVGAERSVCTAWGGVGGCTFSCVVIREPR